MGKRVRSLPALYDVEVRKKIVDGHKDYQQILSYPQPTIEKFAKTPADIDEYLPHHQRRLCRIMRQGEAIIFRAGWRKSRWPRPTRALPKPNDPSNNSARSACKFIPTSPASRSIGRNFVRSGKRWMSSARQCGCIRRRGAETPDYISEDRSLYEIWWTFGWSYETATAMARLVFARIMDDYPNLKIITHHFGGIVPMLEGRLGPGNDVLGSRTSDTDYVALRKSLKKRRAGLLQEGLLGRHRGVHRRSGDQSRHGILSTRQNRFRLGLSVRSRRRNAVSAGNHANP